VLKFAADCPERPQTLEVGYDFFFDLDPQHRWLLRFEANRQTHTGRPQSEPEDLAPAG